MRGVRLLTTEEHFIPAKQIKDFCVRLFKAVGVPEAEAEINADNLVEADLAGVESHGVSRMPIYLKRIRCGVVNPVCSFEIISEAAATAVVDAHNSMGAAVSKQVMELTIQKARIAGMAFSVVRNSNHYGMASYYTKMAAAKDMIGISATNGPPRMAPWGGREAYFGTNPFAVSIPAGKELPVTADMATSVVARGKILIAAKKHKPIPPDWALDKMGRNTTDPNEALIGTVLPFAGPKGSAIALLIDALTGVLGNSMFGTQINDMYADFENPSMTSHCFGAVNIAAFQPVADFEEHMDRMIREIKANTKADNVTEIFLPGEIELRKRSDRLISGIPLAAVVMEDLKLEAEQCGILFDLTN